MARYYALIASLPNLALEAQKPPYSLGEFYEELQELLTGRDKELLDWLRLERDNKELIRLLELGAFAPKGEGEAWDQGDEDDDEDSPTDEGLTTNLPLRELRRVARLAQRGQWTKKSEVLPAYMLHFVCEQYYRPAEDETPHEPSPLSPEDRLSQLYYAAAGRCRNAFLGAWFAFNQTLRNVLSVYTCRRLDWPVERYIVGDGPVEQQLLTSRAADFGLSELVPQINSLIHIAQERDIARRERLIDALRWHWLEDETDRTVFDIENVLSYYLRLGILERWHTLDKEQGEKTFRQIVLGLKAESNASLAEFRRSVRK